MGPRSKARKRKGRRSSRVCSTIIKPNKWREGREYVAAEPTPYNSPDGSGVIRIGEVLTYKSCGTVDKVFGRTFVTAQGKEIFLPGLAGDWYLKKKE